MNRALIEKADRLLSREKGTIVKDPGGKLTVCLAYPNSYYLGMSNLGFQGIYGLLNSHADVLCERAFLPEPRDVAEHLRTGTPLFSLESKRPLSDFDILAFSISFENDYPAVLRMLELARVPRRPSERSRYHPVVIAGGVCCFFNPEPFAPFIDVVFVGEAEESLAEFLQVCRESDGRGEIKERAARLPGVYIPEFYEIRYDEEGRMAGRIAHGGAPAVIRRRVLQDLSRSPVTTAIVTEETEFSNMYLAEAMRGCPWNCRFCVVSRIYNPPRRKAMSALMAEIDRARGLEARVGLIGPSLTDYDRIRDVLCIGGVDFSITSLRASPKSADLIELLKGRRSVSIAPEAGTERMRRVINKQVTESDILGSAERLFAAGVQTVRLYFMIGLPTERAEDIEGIVAMVGKVRALSETGTVAASVSCFVPKPFTPFQWHPMEDLRSLKEKMRFIEKGLSEKRNLRVLHDVPKYAVLQGLLSRGDRRVSALLEGMVETDDWQTASARAGIRPDFYTARSRGRDETLPWDFIDAGVSKEQLWEDYQKALSL